MPIQIKRSIDIENVVREALAPYMTAYCLPLPASVDLPSVAVEQVGGRSANTIDEFDIVLDVRAKNEAESLETMRNAVGILKAVAESQTTPMHYVSENTKPAWIIDTVRPDVAMCRARLSVTVHMENVTINEIRSGGFNNGN